MSLDDSWYVLFSDSKSNRVGWLRPSYRHVLAMRQEDELIWHVVNYGESHLDVTYELVSDYETPADYAPDAVIVKWDQDIEQRLRGGICHFNCVEVTKALLGIKSFFTFTPYQLYKYMLRHGGEHFHE